MSTVWPRCRSGAVGSKPGLDAQRHAALQPLLELRLDEQLVGAAPDDLQLFVDERHASSFHDADTRVSRPEFVACRRQYILLSFAALVRLRTQNTLGKSCIKRTPLYSKSCCVSPAAQAFAAPHSLPCCPSSASLPLSASRPTRSPKKSRAPRRRRASRCRRSAARRPREETYWREERIQRGDTFASLLTRLRIEDPNAVRFLRSSNEAQGLAPARPGPHRARRTRPRTAG